MKIKRFIESQEIDWRKISKDKPNFEIGDYVYCINDDSSFLKYGKKYIVTYIKFTDYKYEENYCIVKLKEYPGFAFYSAQFVSEIEWNLIKYNL